MASNGTTEADKRLQFALLEELAALSQAKDGALDGAVKDLRCVGFWVVDWLVGGFGVGGWVGGGAPNTNPNTTTATKRHGTGAHAPTPARPTQPPPPMPQHHHPLHAHAQTN